jgi:hypothetical protein
MEASGITTAAIAGVTNEMPPNRAKPIAMLVKLRTELLSTPL